MFKYLMIALLGAAAVAALPSPALAQDTLRLDLRQSNDAPILDLDSEDDTVLVRFYRGYNRSFGYRSYGFGSAYNYRPFSYGYSRSYYNYGYNNYGYNFSYYRPYNYSFYYSRPAYYYSTPYYYSAPYYSTPFYYSPYNYCPIGDTAPAMPYATSAQPSYTVLRQAPTSANLPVLTPYSAPVDPNGTYPYNGGPSNPVPLPSVQPAPQAQPTVPLEGRAVSLPKEEKKYTYPAYGEGSTSFAQDRVVPLKEASAQRGSR